MISFPSRFIPAAMAASLFISPAMATEQGDWLLRFGLVNVMTDESNNDATIPADTLDLDDNMQLFASAIYMLRKNIGVEILAATPFTHEIKGKGALAGLGKIGEVSHLPPTVSVQYHFSPDAGVRPYVGAGINYTMFFSETTSGGTVTSLKLDDSIGLAVQAGVDIDINDKWFFNADLRYINIETTATTNLGDIEVDVNPAVISLGVGTRF